MAQAGRTFRIFISSTFNDLKEERNALQKHVFPRLRELCAVHGCRFQEIDLRWGVRDEAALDQQTVKICLEEIKRCQETTPRPNFVVLLGDRYGWQPLPAEIPFKEFDQIKERVTDRDDRKILERWYKRDDNADPAVYCLQPRKLSLPGDATDEEQEAARVAEAAEWSQTEQELRKIIIDALSGLNLSEQERIKYSASATEQEILAGAIDLTNAREHVFCFFRQFIELPQGLEAKDFVDLDLSFKLDGKAHDRLVALKQKLEDTLPGNIKSYDTEWRDNRITIDHIGALPVRLEDCLKLIDEPDAPANLCVDVWRRLAKVILTVIQKLDEATALDLQIASHNEFGMKRARSFKGRADAVTAIADYLKDDADHGLLAVYGESGSGKSALIARAYAQASTAHPNALVIGRFIGATPDSSSARSLLQSLCQQIARSYQPEKSIETNDYRALIAEFANCLALATRDGPLIIFLDALDQLSTVDNARNLVWLPTQLPPNVRVIVSTLPGECLSALNRKRPAPKVWQLEPMEKEEGAAMLSEWLRDAGRKLRDDQQAEVLNKFEANGLPLYLKLAFEDARRWKSYHEKRTLSPTVEGITRDLFGRLSADHGPMLISRSLGYMCASKNGLSEDELLDVLAIDKEFFDDFKLHAHHDLPAGEGRRQKLPVVVWSRLRFDLEHYLTERSGDGTSLLDFYHQQMGKIAAEEFLKEDKQERHGVLAAYFEGQPLWRDQYEEANLRKVSELPYTQAHAGMWSKCDEHTGLEGTLCNLEFLHAKATAGMVYDGINDYELARSLLTRTSESSDSNEAISMLLAEFATAFNQEFHTFRDRARTTAQQLFNNLFARGGYEGTAGAILKAFMARGIYPDAGIWLRRANTAPATSTSATLQRTVPAHELPVTSLAVSPSGSRIASGDAGGALRVWRAHDGALLASVPAAHEGGVSALAWAPGDPEERQLVSAGRDQEVRVWEWRAEQQLRSWRAHNEQIRGLVFLPASELRQPSSDAVETQTSPSRASSEADIVTCSDDKTLRGWNSLSGAEIWTLRGHLDRVFSLDAGEGPVIISGSEDRTVKLWDLDPPRELQTLRGSQDSVRCVAIGPESTWAVSAGDDSMLRIWNLESGNELVARGHLHRVNCIGIGNRGAVCSPHEMSDSERALTHFIVSGSDDETVRVWDSQSGDEHAVLHGHAGPVNALACEPKGKWITSGGNDGTVRIWNTAHQSWNQGRVVEHKARVGCIAVDENTDIIATGSDDHTIKLWNRDGGRYRDTLRGHLGPITSLLALDNKCLVSGSEDRTLKVWNTSTGDLRHTLGSPFDFSGIAARIPTSLKTSSGHKNALTCLAHVGNNLVASGSKDSTVRLWDIDAGTEICEFTGARGIIEHIEVSKSLGLLIAVGSAREIAVWQLSDAAAPQLLKGHTSRISCAALAKEQFLVTGSLDKTVRLWNLSAGTSRCFEGHAEWVTCVATDPEAQVLISGGKDARVVIWDTSSNKSVHVLTRHTGPIRGVAIVPSSGQVLSYADDQCLIVSDVQKGLELGRVHIDSPITSMVVISPDEICLGTRRGGLALMHVEYSAPAAQETEAHRAAAVS